jgi:DNA-binding CsgD family transcriptional regulator
MTNGGENPTFRLVTIFDPAEREEMHRNILASMFRFTPAEVRLAEQVILGASPAQAAEALGVTIHTVRTYLKRLYHKAGVRTQSALVCTLLKAIESVPSAY